MARIRSIKPDFFRHEELFEAEIQSGLPLRLAFAGLWTVCDREGRFRWQPRVLKLDVLPFDQVNFADVLEALARAGFIERYAIDGEVYGHIPSWHKHQQINTRESASRLPAPTEPGEVTSKHAPKQVHAHAFGAYEAKPNEIKGQEKSTCMHMPEQVQVDGEGEREGKGKGKGGGREGSGEGEHAPPNGVAVGSSGADDPPPKVPINGYHLPPCPYQQIVELYHQHLPASPRIEVLNDGRKRLIKARWAEVCASEKRDAAAGVQWFQEFFELAAKSKFLTGREHKKGDRPFLASLEFLMSPSGFAKTYEGRYQ